MDAAFADLGRIDVVVVNAGYGLFGAAEEITDEQVTHQITTNLLGAVQTARAALPHLRAQGGGRLIRISSVAGLAAHAGARYHTRLTADGRIRSCLFSDRDTDLRAALRSDATDDDLAALWRGAMWQKSAGHGIDAPDFAAIADLTGRSSETLDLAPEAAIADLRVALTDRYGEDMDSMLDVAAYLIGDELTRDPSASLTSWVDVLPSFAGG
ncbi:NAD(P)-dependent dehydrogenase (short-subunit alcohol dehydrogenase family) [Nocardia sp. GAS34]